MPRRAVVVLLAVVPLLAIVVAVVIVGGGSSKAPSRLPVAVGASGARSDTTAAGADMASMPYQSIRYEATEALPLLGGAAHAYKLTSDVSVDDVRRLAEALGVAGEPVEQAPDVLTVGDSERQLSVQRTGGGLWYFSSARTVSSSGVAVACAPNEPCEPPITTIPERPAGLPNQEEARAQALEVLTASGMDVEQATVAVFDNITQWQVSVEPIVDGLPTSGLGATVTIGPDGIDFANGNLGAPTKADEYPLLDTRAAIEQLNTSGLYYGGGPEPAIAIDTPAIAPDPATTIQCITTPCDSAPPESVPPRVVTITGAARGLVFAPTYTGTDAYLVPAYFFNTPDGEGPRALAIDLSYIEPPSTATDPGGVDSGSGGGKPGSDGSGGQPGSIEPSGPISTPGCPPPDQPGVVRTEATFSDC
jgi:hypothetical protein